MRRSTIVANYEDGAMVLLVDHDEDMIPVNALRRAARNFLNSLDGEPWLRMRQLTRCQFNWGDLIMALDPDDDFLEEEGIRWLEVLDIDYTVDHDESLGEL